MFLTLQPQEKVHLKLTHFDQNKGAHKNECQILQNMSSV